MKKSAGSHLPADQNIQSIKVDYLRVILAPSASSFVLMSLASSLDAPCLRTFGAPSTTSLASLRPRPVTSRKTLITLTLFGPTSVSSTSNSVFSSSAAAPAPAAATTTPAAGSHRTCGSADHLCGAQADRQGNPAGSGYHNGGRGERCDP